MEKAGGGGLEGGDLPDSLLGASSCIGLENLEVRQRHAHNSVFWCFCPFSWLGARFLGFGRGCGRLMSTCTCICT